MSNVSFPAPARPPPPQLPGIFLRLAPQMKILDAFLHEQLQAFEPEIRSMVEYCLDTTGKRIRPALVYLSGWTGGEKASPDLTRAAAVVELVHLATLVHDDIMDEAELRRNRRTAAYEFGPAAAVLLGDALFAHALHLAAQFPTTEVCAAVAESTRRVCAGEILQTLRRRSIAVTRADYLRVIDLKTAELFRVSCFLGARLAQAPAAFVASVSSFGRHLGTAYQMYDDLADFFGDPAQIGKTLGTDLASGKLTLPLFELLDKLSDAERGRVYDEIAGRRVAHPADWARQMASLDIFGSVRQTILAELLEAEQDLADWKTTASVPLLAELSLVLRSQMELLARDEPTAVG